MISSYYRRGINGKRKNEEFKSNNYKEGKISFFLGIVGLVMSIQVLTERLNRNLIMNKMY